MTSKPAQDIGLSLEREDYARDVEAFFSQPAMATAARRFGEGFIAQFEHRPLLNLVVSDRGRMLMSWFALYFDACYDPEQPGSGFTVNRFKSACQDTGLCSRGRAGAMIGIMRFAGYVVPAHEMRKGYPLRLEPTEKLRSAFRLRLVNVFQALALVVPEGAIGQRLLGNPRFERAFIRAVFEEFLARERPVSFAPAMTLFGESKAGVLILMALIATTPGNDISLDAPMTVPIARLAARFDVSRPQVKALLDRAVAEGLLRTADSEPGAFFLSEALRRDLIRILSAFFVVATKGVRMGAEAAGA
jgi:hypothetical protein